MPLKLENIGNVKVSFSCLQYSHRYCTNGITQRAVVNYLISMASINNRMLMNEERNGAAVSVFLSVIDSTLSCQSRNRTIL